MTLTRIFRLTDSVVNSALWLPHVLGLIDRVQLQATIDYQVQVHLEKPLDTVAAHKKIREVIESEGPALVTRFGSTEMRMVLRFLGRRTRSLGEKMYAAATRLESPVWVPWEHSPVGTKSGFFPISKQSTEQFAQLMVDSMGEIDLLGSWVPGENKLRPFFPHAALTELSNLSPFSSAEPWTSSLGGKKILVIHPFAKSIERQFVKRHLLFSTPDFLPEFDLITLPAVQSLGTPPAEFQTWFDALDRMHQQSQAIHFDLAIIGCGAYGFPLGAKIRRDGKKAIVLGGLVQLLFGIKGRRWDGSGLYNEHWVRPLEEEKPDGYRGADGGAYW